MRICYDREASVDYAKEWALCKNPRYAVGNASGGADFVSECIYSGCGIMNDTEADGWYYKCGENVGRAWQSNESLCDFLLKNGKNGPFAYEAAVQEVQPGDIALMYSGGNIYQSALISAKLGNSLLVCAHDMYAFMRPVTSYKCSQIKFLHIAGVRDR